MPEIEPPTDIETALPVLFVFDEDRASLEVLIADLSRRFGNDFAVRGAQPAAGTQRHAAASAAERPSATMRPR